MRYMEGVPAIRRSEFDSLVERKVLFWVPFFFFQNSMK